jgi:type II secretory pathway component PulC
MSKKILYPLIILASLLVITIIINSVLYIRFHWRKSAENTHTKTKETETVAFQRDDFRYRPLYKDPFHGYAMPGDSLITEEEKIEPLVLKGIVLGPGEPVVVIENDRGNISVLKKGEELKNLKIISLKKNKVKVEYNKEEFILDIWKE